MPSDNPDPSTSTDTSADADTGGPAVVSLTWWLTRTYHHDVPLAALAEATGRTSAEIAANPAVLTGVAGELLAELLTSYPIPDDAIGGCEVEIATADYDASPTLADLVDTARAAVDAEAEAGRHTPAGLALAVLLAGLRREGITDT